MSQVSRADSDSSAAGAALIDAVNASPVACCVVDDGSTFRAVSDVALALHGSRTREEVLGRGLSDFVPEDRLTGEIEQFKRAVNGEEPVYRSCLQDTEGRVREFTTLVTPNVAPGLHSTLLFTSLELSGVLHDAEDARDLVKVLVASPDPLALRFAADAVEGVGRVGEVVRCASFDRLPAMAMGHRPDLVVLTSSPFSASSDIHGESPLVAAAQELVRFEQENSLGLRALVLTHEDRPDVAKELLALGVLGVFGPTDDPESLPKAITAVANEDIYMSPALAAKLAAGEDGHLGDLTARELGVLRLLALGYTNREVAAELFLSVRTIESHRASIQDEIGVDSRRGLVDFALKNNVIP